MAENVGVACYHIWEKFKKKNKDWRTGGSVVAGEEEVEEQKRKLEKQLLGIQ